MNTIGLLGGMSWESTVPYYEIINQTVAEKRGGLHSAPILLHSFDFAKIEQLQQSGNWDAAAALLGESARNLVAAGANGIALCTNTMHKVADAVADAAGVPLLHIADAVATALLREKKTTVALLGTLYTMQEDFYKRRLWDRGIEVLLPDDWQQHEVNRIIFEELCQGVLSEKSQAFFVALIDTLSAQGAEAVVLACTEIGLLVKQEATAVKLYDTTLLHARAAARFVLKGVEEAL